MNDIPNVKDLGDLLITTNSTMKNANGMIVLTGPHPGIFTNFTQVHSHLVRVTAPS